MGITCCKQRRKRIEILSGWQEEGVEDYTTLQPLDNTCPHLPAAAYTTQPLPIQ